MMLMFANISINRLDPFFDSVPEMIFSLALFALGNSFEVSFNASLKILNEIGIGRVLLQ